MLVNGWHANHIFGNWIITEMLFLEFASVGPMLGQADISTLAQRRTNGWITIGMFTGINLSNVIINITKILSQGMYCKIKGVFLNAGNKSERFAYS